MDCETYIVLVPQGTSRSLVPEDRLKCFARETFINKAKMLMNKLEFSVRLVYDTTVMFVKFNIVQDSDCICGPTQNNRKYLVTYLME